MDYKKLNDIIVSMRRDLHQIPEVGTELPQTKNYVINKLKELGFSYKESSLDSGLVCDIGSGDNVVAIRADMDALPIQEETGCEYASKNGNMHACGHDAHTACLLGAAHYLKENESRLKGKVRLVFQAAEELAVGAHNMLNSGLLEGVKAIVGTHIGTLAAGTPSGEFVLKEGPLMASNDRVFIKVIGKGAHGAYPHLSIDPMLTASQIVQGIYNIKSREILATDPVIISICMIHGGTQYNVIPTEVNIEGTFRTFSEENRAFITERIKEVAESIAAANRAKAEVVIKRRGAPVVNNEKIYEQLNEVCNELGFKKASHYSLSMAGEDFADYLEKIDGAFILFSTATEKNIAHHNSKFEIDESKLYQPPVLMSEWAIKYLENNK
ncbi:M20 family metallopeptidase [Brachyspira hyodysenteriae]|uniref:M20 metallopeptidase family protein n=1 Tax=Brachyspira hyodysenteriae TaxID=159 RepID=UPI00063DCBC4|nr:M20 family metallopeptidase [Brachyspira hyodysenteriae]KLI15863.1 peptidase [Brachyspira hyodysenteriae]KLI27025.1 peptidase [Brachyspira hyodysenteriae]KLI52074.1 peptidase [Brachyspira hyodysenteriae]MCZ9960807.1 M20 family metallopeptidase [Brachyspira hyodysenteriae]MDA0034104.1 M20 family metallopeptidase [Brachyspira hyodysenteriae]